MYLSEDSKQKTASLVRKKETLFGRFLKHSENVLKLEKKDKGRERERERDNPLARSRERKRLYKSNKITNDDR